ncbi:MAG: ABC transporter substrate-binding protein, partial [Bacilli bacterium]|nr:ABC transporter substrate-binding protein [Bacilli bacterium]
MISFLLIFILLLVSFYINPSENEKEEFTKIKVAEVTHSVFYAPFYVAIEKGYFNDEGLDIELLLTPGADKVTAAVLSGDVEIGFCGSEASIYVFNSDEKDYLVNFAGLTKKDGSFLVSRKKIEIAISFADISLPYCILYTKNAPIFRPRRPP